MAEKICPTCGESNKANAITCIVCGNSLRNIEAQGIAENEKNLIAEHIAKDTVCTKCGKKVKQGTIICPECGGTCSNNVSNDNYLNIFKADKKNYKKRIYFIVILLFCFGFGAYICTQTKQMPKSIEADSNTSVEKVSNSRKNIVTPPKESAEQLIVKIRNAYKINASDDVLKLAVQLHRDYRDTPEDIEAQKCVDSINKARQQEKLKKREDELRKIIRVSAVYPYNMDYLGGVDLVINFVNNSDKTIKYITFYCQPFNAVGDAVSCDIRIDSDLNRLSEAAFQATGPYEKGQGITGTSYLWTKAWYNSTIKSVKLNKIEIEYMDGTTEVINKSEVDLVRY